MSKNRLYQLAKIFADQLFKSGAVRDEMFRRARRHETASHLFTKERIPTLTEEELRGFFGQLEAMQYFFDFDDLIAGAGIDGLRSALCTLITSAEDGSLGNNLKNSFPIAGQGAGPGLISQIINARFPQKYWVYSRETTPKQLRHLGFEIPEHQSSNSYTAAGTYMQQILESIMSAGAVSADYLIVDQFLWWAYWGQRSEPQAWLFSAGAEHYRNVAQLGMARPGQDSGDAIRWAAAAPRHRKEPHAGDIAVLWQSGQSRGIVAAGLITTEPDDGRVALRYTHVPSSIIESTELSTNPILDSLEILTTPHPPSYPLTTEQWKEIEKLLVASPPRPPFHLHGVIAASLSSQGLHFTPLQIATYYTALQTKGFAILSGISGTGKTKLAQHFAELLPQPASPEPAVRDSIATFTVGLSMLKWNQFVIPQSMTRLFNPLPPNKKYQVKVHFEGGAALCTVSQFAGDGYPGMKFILSGPVREWFHETLALGDPFTLDPQLDDEQNLTGFHISKGSEHPEEFQQGDNHGSNLLFVPVRPDWRDSKSLLGYYNPLTSTYEWTDFLRFLQRAERSYKDGDGFAWFVILDEMNLAHVEYYFADLLSVLESGRYEDGEMAGLSREPLRFSFPEDAEGDLPPRELRLPPNLYVVGTVNVDETTHAFSPKVLDRAFTLEFTDVDFAAYPPQLNGDATAHDADTARQLLTAFTQDGTFERVDKGTIAAFVADQPEVRDRLQSLNNLLKSHDMHFGYRVFDEIVTFLSAAEQNEMFAHEEGDDPALDAAVLMKVLPKFHGSRGKLEAPLRAVLAWCLNPEIPDRVRIDGALANVEDTDHATASLQNLPFSHPRTATRTIRMLRALYTDGFAAFG